MKEVRSLGPNELLVVRFNERGQPYGEMQPTLANYVGTVARNGNILPLEYLDWRRIPQNRLNDAWDSLTLHFHISERHKNIVMQNMGVVWRRWRTEIKARSYDPNIPLNELLSIRPIPHNLSIDDWEALCKHWKSTERSSKINQENAYKKRGIHAQGRTNIPSLEYKFFKENGRKPTRIEILHLSRQSKKKGGAPIDDEAIRCETLLEEAVQRHLRDKSEGTQPREVHESAFRDVFGPERSGRVRCLGAGALPSRVFPEQFKRRHYHGDDHDSDFTENFKEMDEKIKELEAREAIRQAELEVRETQRQAEMEAREAEREAKRRTEMEAREAEREVRRQTEMELMMRQMQEQQLQNLTRVMQIMMSGAAVGSREPESLPAQMAAMMTSVMQQHMTNASERTRESTNRDGSS